jgi:hypothetical protein
VGGRHSRGDAARAQIQFAGSSVIGSDGFQVLDLWDSKQQFDSFVQNRLAVGVAAAGISSQPKVEFADSLSVFAPNV